MNRLLIKIALSGCVCALLALGPSAWAAENSDTGAEVPQTGDVTFGHGAEKARGWGLSTGLFSACCPTESLPGLVRFSLDSAQDVFLGIYDGEGKLVSEVIEEKLAPGMHAAIWGEADAKAAEGRYALLSTNSGLFLQRLTR